MGKANTAPPGTPAEFNAFDDDPWIVRLVDFVKEILAQDRVKIIGVCYGHQIVGRALGATVGRSESGAWETSVCQVALTDQGKELFGGRDTLVSHPRFVRSFVRSFIMWPLLYLDPVLRRKRPIPFHSIPSLTNKQSHTNSISTKCTKTSSPVFPPPSTSSPSAPPPPARSKACSSRPTKR